MPQVDAFVSAYEKRTGNSIKFETPSDTYRRLLNNIERMTKTEKREEMRKRGIHRRGLSEGELGHRLIVLYTKETRQKRLQEAQHDKDHKIIQHIRREAGGERSAMSEANRKSWSGKTFIFITPRQRVA